MALDHGYVRKADVRIDSVMKRCSTRLLTNSRRFAAVVEWEDDMGQKEYCVVSGVLFTLVALAHLLRIVFGMSIQVDGFAVPMLVSWVGLVVPAGLAFWAFRISRNSGAA